RAKPSRGGDAKLWAWSGAAFAAWAQVAWLPKGRAGEEPVRPRAPPGRKIRGDSTRSRDRQAGYVRACPAFSLHYSNRKSWEGHSLCWRAVGGLGAAEVRQSGTLSTRDQLPPCDD